MVLVYIVYCVLFLDFQFQLLNENTYPFLYLYVQWIFLLDIVLDMIEKKKYFICCDECSGMTQQIGAHDKLRYLQRI